MPLYQKGRSAIPLSQLASNGKTYSPSANHLKHFSIISRGYYLQWIFAPTTWVKSALFVEDVEKSREWHRVRKSRPNTLTNMSRVEYKGSSDHSAKKGLHYLLHQDSTNRVNITESPTRNDVVPEIKNTMSK